jgi:hypothetical protein
LKSGERWFVSRRALAPVGLLRRARGALALGVVVSCGTPPRYVQPQISVVRKFKKLANHLDSAALQPTCRVGVLTRSAEKNQ